MRGHFCLHPQSTFRTAPPPLLIEALRNELCIHSGSKLSHSPARNGQQWLFVQTAGSGGLPKTIRRTPESWIASFEVNAALFGIGPNDCVAVLGQMGHSLALYAVVEAVHLGADVMCLGGAAPRTQARELANQSATVLYATPTQLRLLIRNGPKLPALRLIMSGGGKLDASTRKALEQFCPNAEIREFFGAGETSFISICDTSTPEGSVGRAYPNVALDIRGGEVWVQSPYLFDGYETGTSPDTRHDGSYLSIGEMGYVDEDGYLFIQGRKSRMITVADQNVFPEDAERVLLSVARSRSVAVIGCPDPMRGQVLVAMIEGTPDPELEAAIVANCRAQLGPASVPRRIVFLEDFPMLAAGKPDLRALATVLESSR